MDFLGTKLGMSVLLVLLTVTVVTSRSIDLTEQELFRPVDFSSSLAEDAPSENELLKYLLTKELMSRRGNFFESFAERAEKAEPPKKKKYYWKQCAFNAVTCFG